MEIILTEDVAGLGDIGETVKVKAGYARNYLIPRGLAKEAGTASAKQLAHWMKQIDAKKKKLKVAALDRAGALSGVKVVVELRVGEHNRVFGSIGAREISQKLIELGYEFDRRRVLLAEPIKKLGEHKVSVKLHQEVTTEITVQVNARKATREEEDYTVTQARENLEQATSEEE